MSKRRKRPPQTPVTAVVENFSHDGRGIARIEGKATFIQGALPDETVTFQYTRQKKDFDEGRLLTVEKASSYRVEPKCPHYWACGGCSLQHLEPEAQIHFKQKQLLDLLERTGRVQPEQVLDPLTATYWHYRNKARLSVRFVEKKGGTLVGFREKTNPRFIAEIESCAVLNAKIDAEIKALRALVDALSDPRIIAQIEVAAGDDEVALIFRNLSPLEKVDEEKLREYGQKTGFKIFLQPGGTDSVHLFYPEECHEYLTYHLPQEGIQFQFHPTDFTQVNAELNRKMVRRAIELLAPEDSDSVLDLFCGLGNFSLPIAKQCKQVVGVEGSEQMVERARMNSALNHLQNTEFFAANLDDPESYKHFAKYQFDKVLLDPPRTGAIEAVKYMRVINPKRIVYVSCNPATLARDADVLVNEHGYTLKAAGVMDMFTHTAHVESIALFVK